MKIYFLFLIEFVISFITKLNKEELENGIIMDNLEQVNYNLKQIYINKLNSTHFSCDNNQKILSLDKFNDNYCDCEDGSDENQTNACTNGMFYCNNYLYFSKIISTSKINDGICDCCDGTDESNSNCLNECLYLSNIEYKKYISNFNTLTSVLDSYSEESTKEYFNDTFIYISEVNNTYNKIKELYQDKI